MCILMQVSDDQILMCTYGFWTGIASTKEELRIKVPCDISSKKEIFFFFFFFKLATNAKDNWMLLVLQERRNEGFLVALLSQEYAPKDVCSILEPWMKSVLDTKEDVSLWRVTVEEALTEAGRECGDIVKGHTSFCKWVLAPVNLWEACIQRAEWWCTVVVPKPARAVLMLHTSRFFLLLFTCRSSFCYWFPGAYNINTVNNWLVDWRMMLLWSC